MGLMKNNIVIGIVAIVLLSVTGGYYLLKDPQADALLVSETTGNTEVDKELLATLLELKSLNFSSRIFENPAFKSLVDFSSQIPDEPKGRVNPFAPVGSDRAITTEAVTE
jgi:hypothetical protein